MRQTLILSLSRITEVLGVDGQVLSIFVMILAVAEAAVALGIVLNLYNNFATVNVDEANTMKD